MEMLMRFWNFSIPIGKLPVKRLSSMQKRIRAVDKFASEPGSSPDSWLESMRSGSMVPAREEILGVRDLEFEGEEGLSVSVVVGIKSSHFVDGEIEKKKKKVEDENQK
ncbi:hypothetical protein LOK49_LG05G02638 [Camellia lanceoleosa]|uniref:Uncharacterized protein n=1 Tax=Camellia lanceoleosa TaxID=1840588 RepID=A0ACC0HSV6_9ERIC|nr:hypothetical protein LOK49_LG05G02638 [Camellia lanceoleosa]